MVDLKHMRVLVTATSFGNTDPSLKKTLESAVGEVIYNPFGRPLTTEELILRIKPVDGFIAGLDDISGAVMQAAERLKVISRYGVGVDRVDLHEAARRGIVVTNTPGANAVAVAELTIGLILALSRNLCEANQATHQGQWPRVTGIGLRGKTVGLVGIGAIGKEVAMRLFGFGCRLLATDPAIGKIDAEKMNIQLVSLDELLSQADVISLHIPATPATAKMINRQTLNRIKPGAFLINTARGELIDETALKEALDSGRLKGAALDVYSEEPPAKDHALLRHPQVIMTPHMAARTDEAMNQMGKIAMEECLTVLRGQRPVHVVNPETYPQ